MIKIKETVQSDLAKRMGPLKDSLFDEDLSPFKIYVNIVWWGGHVYYWLNTMQREYDV